MHQTMRCLGFWLCVAVGIGGWSTAGAQEAKTTPLYDQVLEKLGSLQPTAEIEVRVGTEKEKYQLGDPFEVRFRVSEDCYVVLMDIGSAKAGQNGEITFLIPNRQFLDQKVTGGKVYSTVYDFGMSNVKIGPPEGVETVNLLCSPEKIELFAPNFEKEAVHVIRPNDEARLKQLLARLDQLTQVKWAGDSVKFTIGNAPRAVGREYGALPPIKASGSSGKFWPPIKASGSSGKTDDKNKE